MIQSNEFYEKNKGGEFYYLTKYGKKLIPHFDYSEQRKIIILSLEEKQMDYLKNVIENNRRSCIKNSDD